MIIDSVGFYKTRGGDKVEVVAIRDGIAIVHRNGFVSIRNLRGQINFESICSNEDLFEKYQEPRPPVVFEGWYFVSANGKIHPCDDEDDASSAVEAIPGRKALHIRYDSSKPINEKIQVIGE